MSIILLRKASQTVLNSCNRQQSFWTIDRLDESPHMIAAQRVTRSTSSIFSYAVVLLYKVKVRVTLFFNGGKDR